MLNPVLLDREIGVETDTLRAKIGDGSTSWSGLSYAFPANWGAIGGTLSDQIDLQAALDALQTAITGKQPASPKLSAIAATTPAPDGTYSSPGSITVQNGLITAIS